MKAARKQETLWMRLAGAALALAVVAGGGCNGDREYGFEGEPERVPPAYVEEDAPTEREMARRPPRPRFADEAEEPGRPTARAAQGLQVEIMASDESVRLTESMPVRIRVTNPTEYDYQNVVVHWKTEGEATSGGGGQSPQQSPQQGQQGRRQQGGQEARMREQGQQQGQQQQTAGDQRQQAGQGQVAQQGRQTGGQGQAAEQGERGGREIPEAGTGERERMAAQRRQSRQEQGQTAQARQGEQGQAGQGRQTAQTQARQGQTGGEQQTAQTGQSRMGQTGQGQTAQPGQGGTPGPMAAPQEGRSMQRIGTLPAGESHVVTAQVSPQSTGQLRLCAWAEGVPAECTTMQVVKPELTLERSYLVRDETHQNLIAFACDELGIEYVIRNTGSGTIEDLVFEEQLPQGLTTQDGQTQIRRQIGSLEAGEEEVIRVALAEPEVGTYDGKATIRHGDLQGSSEQGTLKVVKPQLELTVDAPQQIEIGRADIVSVSIRNTGEAPALDAAMAVEGLGEFEPVEENFANGRLPIGRIDAGQTRQVRLRLRPEQAGQVSGRIMLDAYCLDRIEQPVELQVRGIPAIEVEAIDEQDPVAMGDEFGYEVVVRNEGNGEALNITVRGRAPDGISFTGFENAPDDAQAAGDRFQLTIPNLPPGAEDAFVVTATARNAGRFQTMRLEVQAEEMSEPVIEEVKTTVRQQVAAEF